MIDVGKLTSQAAKAATLAGVQSFAPPPPRHPEVLNRDLIAASLASGMIAASGRAHTAVAVWRRVRAALAP